MLHRFAQHLLAFQPQDFFCRFVEQGNNAFGIGNQYAISHRFQDGLRAAGLDLLAAQHVPQVFGLVADQAVQFRVIDRHGHLVGGGLHQVHLI